MDLLSKSAAPTLGTQERRDVEGQLKQLGMISFTAHVSDLCSIIGAPEIPNDNPCKDFAAIYLKNYLRTTLESVGKNGKMKAGAQTLLPGDYQQAAESIVSLITSKQIGSELRNSHVQSGLEMILFSTQKLKSGKVDLINSVFQFIFNQEASLHETITIVYAVLSSCQQLDHLLNLLQVSTQHIAPRIA